jgi:arylamine N-acetyltransferase
MAVAIDLMKSFFNEKMAQSYLTFIGIGDLDSIALPRNSDLLKKAVEGHIKTIAFNNLDTHCKIPVTIDLHSIYNKVVLEKRGGFCFELVSLFAAALLYLRFDVKLLLCNVHLHNKG